jgi:hypothetical protein
MNTLSVGCNVFGASIDDSVIKRAAAAGTCDAGGRGGSDGSGGDWRNDQYNEPVVVPEAAPLPTPMPTPTPSVATYEPAPSPVSYRRPPLLFLRGCGVWTGLMRG